MKHMSFVLIALAALALIVAGCDREITGDVALADQSASDCFDCHSDQNLFLLQVEAQWVHSAHATSPTVERNRIYQSSYQGCERCHTAEGFISFVTGEPLEDPIFFTHIGCFTCHAPHSNGNLTVRVDDPVTLENGAVYDGGSASTCATCHHARQGVDTYVTETVAFRSIHWGPHYSTETDMFAGTNGYEYEGYDYSNSAHTTVVDSGCPQCHMADPAVFAPVGGHTFNVVYEEEVEGIPDSFEVIASNFSNACGQCHESFDDINPVFPADIDYDNDGISEGVQTEIHGLLEELGDLLLAAGLVVDTLGVLEPNPADTTTADSAGAVWNYLFVENEGSFGIHNTNYAVALLQSSIEFLGGGTPAVPGRPSIYSAH